MAKAQGYTAFDVNFSYSFVISTVRELMNIFCNFFVGHSVHIPEILFLFQLLQ